MDSARTGGFSALLPHIVFVVCLLLVWEGVASQKWLNPAFFGSPHGIWHYLWDNLFASPNLIIDFGWTALGTLGATPAQLFFLVTLPGAVPVIFSGPRLGLIYALLGVVGGEIIASEHGLGQTLSYLSSTFHIDGVFALLLVLALLGVAVVRGMTRLEKYLQRWQ